MCPVGVLIVVAWSVGSELNGCISDSTGTAEWLASLRKPAPPSPMASQSQIVVDPPTGWVLPDGARMGNGFPIYITNNSETAARDQILRIDFEPPIEASQFKLEPRVHDHLDLGGHSYDGGVAVMVSSRGNSSMVVGPTRSSLFVQLGTVRAKEVFGYNVTTSLWGRGGRGRDGFSYVATVVPLPSVRPLVADFTFFDSFADFQSASLIARDAGIRLMGMINRLPDGGYAPGVREHSQL